MFTFYVQTIHLKPNNSPLEFPFQLSTAFTTALLTLHVQKSNWEEITSQFHSANITRHHF